MKPEEKAAGFPAAEKRQKRALLLRAEIFTYLTHNEVEIAIYGNLYASLATHVLKPDLVAHLAASVEFCLGHIKKCGCAHEESISIEDLKSLYEAQNFYFGFRGCLLLVVKTNGIHFLERKDEREGDPVAAARAAAARRDARRRADAGHRQEGQEDRSEEGLSHIYLLVFFQ